MTKKSSEGQNLRLDAWESLRYAVGAGQVLEGEGAVRLILGSQDGSVYSNAQLDDYSEDNVMRWQPSVRLSIRARFSHAEGGLRGTCGFGLWNDPLGMTASPNKKAWIPRVRLPQTVWFFFAAPPSKLPWAYGVPGVGWKVATLDASRWRTRLLLPFAPVAMLVCRVQWIYARLWPWIQGILKIDEKLVGQPMEVWHDYQIVWKRDDVTFWIDNEEIFRTGRSPRGPLGLVIWIDNQFMVATPQGLLRHGVVATEEQWLEIAALEVSSIDEASH